VPISGTIVKIDPGLVEDVRSRLDSLRDLKVKEERQVEGAQGVQKFDLLTTVDDIEQDGLGTVVKASMDGLISSRFRGGVDWARVTRSYRIRIFDEGFVLFDCSRRDFQQFIYPFEQKILGLKDAFRMCAISSDEFDRLVNDPKTIEVRASAFSDFQLSSVSTGSLYGFNLEKTKEFSDFKRRAELRTLMVKMTTAYGPMTMLITQDCGFVLYSKVVLGEEAKVFEELVKAIALPMID
jgi:hypothetical protein